MSKCRYDLSEDCHNKDCLNCVLDKIEAEIQENINYNKKMNYQGIIAGLLLTLDIIDKYKGEGEDAK